MASWCRPWPTGSECCGCDGQIHMDRSPMEKKGQHGHSEWERAMTPAWTGFCCFSGYITLRIVLICYAQVCFRWLPFFFKFLNIYSFFFTIILFLKKFLLLFNYSCMPFLPIPPPHPSQSYLPPPSPLHPPPWFCPCVLYSSSCNPLSSLSPPHSPLAIVRLFLTSMSLVIFCLLFSSVDYVPVKGEIIWRALC